MTLPKRLAFKAALAIALAVSGVGSQAVIFDVELPRESPEESYDGRLILIIAASDDKDPLDQVSPDYDAAQIFGINVEDWQPGSRELIDSDVLGFPARSIKDMPEGEYYVQAVLHKYDTFNLSNGKTVQLPAARGAGQNWRKEPGNLYSKPVKLSIRPDSKDVERLVLSEVNPPIDEPEDTEYVRHIKIRSELLSEFWGTDVYLRAHVLVPHGFDDQPDARFPLAIFHGHFPADFGGFQTTPPDPEAECVYSKRFDLDCYNRIQEQEAYDFYQYWISDDAPRMLITEIDHSNPYYDDSYAVNSDNIGPYGDAITYELVPAIEDAFRGIGEGWSRFVYGGSTGGWEALAVQVKYPDEYNGAFAACPDPIDFRQFVTVNIYEDDNAYYREGPFGRIERPSRRNYLGHISRFMEMENRWELVLGDNTRSGQQYDIWQAVFSPNGDDGYPKPIWDKRSGEIDPEVAEYWRENYDLRYIMERDWKELGPKLQGKIHLYVGDMDNYYLNNAVYLTEDFLESAQPSYQGVVDYGDRAEHCWNGDHENPNAVSRLRYNTLYVPRILQRIQEAAPEGADLTSWRY
ncbi:alpha/beta hydrolase-fold protein [Chromatocurvus halotolerans]|uniref:Putative esterase n=1 Tax=Chromatocurvus halotolerans TaxID=1132028 RepID=A0A4R2KW11_9GAMM|nr:alpha/beta hydrolase-fold protein [Chromatocurvus halotolerans]TCO77027.1 putative esterase [Chromatocurvus halotolerans]